MFLYYGYLLPLSTRIRRGLYQDGIWTDSGFMRYTEIGGLTWKGDDTLVLASRQKTLARRLRVPGRPPRRSPALPAGEDRRSRDRVRRRPWFTSRHAGYAGICVVRQTGNRLKPVAESLQRREPIKGARQWPHVLPGRATSRSASSRSRCGLSRDRVERDHLVQPAPRRLPDQDPAEEVVPEVRDRADAGRHRQGLRVREGPLGGRRRRRHRQGQDRVDQDHQPAAVHRRRCDRSDVRGQGVLPRARRPDGRRRLLGDA